MDLQNDFKELLESFNARQVEYVVVGGHAVIRRRMAGAWSSGSATVQFPVRQPGVRQLCPQGGSHMPTR